MDKLEGDLRKFWSTINNLSGIGKNKNGKKCTKLVDESGNIYQDLEAATFLDNFHANVGPTLAQKHKKGWNKEKCKIRTASSFSFSWVTERRVKNLVKEICITKSSAIDELNTRIIKDAFDVLSFELMYMYNAGGDVKHGIFPKEWGESKVTPIPKTKSNSTKPGDWRPISQICITGKLLEKIINSQLYHYLGENKLLSENQFGFRKGLSTGLAILM